MVRSTTHLNLPVVLDVNGALAWFFAKWIDCVRSGDACYSAAVRG